MSKTVLSVAIDGPSGAGKSTIAKKIAKEIGFIYVDTGALYRAIGLYAVEAGLDTANANQVNGILGEINIELRAEKEGQQVFLNDKNVSGLIRRHDISMAASNVSAIPEVRAFLLELQRKIARENSCIMDGRDIGTVILPNADLKIFLTATPEDRAQRRFLELKERGQDVSYETVLKDVMTRDYNDSNRDAAPLKQAPDAVLVDTTGNTLEQSVKILTDLVKTKLKIG